MIIVDKCDSSWADEECLNPAVWAKIRYGQFGDKCAHLYCASCRDKRYNLDGLSRGEVLLREIFNERPEDLIWEPYEEAAA